MKIAITGANGRVGQALVADLTSRGHEIIPLTRAQLDLENVEEISSTLTQWDFDCLINPAAMSAPDLCETQPERCHRINALAPQRMAAYCADKQKRFLHFSTDYVFGGEGKGKCQEDDLCAPINHYGRCKREAEIAVLATYEQALVVRVSWVYGGNIPGFVDQVIHKLQHQDPLSAVADKWSIPTLLPDLCEWMAFLCEQPIRGILQACHDGEPISWHGLAEAVRDAVLRQGKISQAPAITAQSLAEVTTFVAPRPVHTAMSSARLSSILPKPIAPWREALERWVGQLDYSSSSSKS